MMQHMLLPPATATAAATATAGDDITMWHGRKDKHVTNQARWTQKSEPEQCLKRQRSSMQHETEWQESLTHGVPTTVSAKGEPAVHHHGKQE
jgi:hypothetical protein